ncbi:MAG TPA: sulfite exporter TauE/SafE family protein [Candidatus Coproplasma excrementipullorum]|nr:sulfite exporter TauE/SafE family protein [Candidatus Coproplasma excrementipullorum]
MNKHSVAANVKERLLSGSLIGIINGLFGGGGGMIAVPVLTELLGYPQKEAHATAIAVIAPVCAVSAVSYIIGGYAYLSVIIPAALGNVAGGVLGARLLGKLPQIVVQLCFVVVMLAAGIRMMI